MSARTTRIQSLVGFYLLARSRVYLYFLLHFSFSLNANANAYTKHTAWRLPPFHISLYELLCYDNCCICLRDRDFVFIVHYILPYRHCRLSLYLFTTLHLLESIRIFLIVVKKSKQKANSMPKLTEWQTKTQILQTSSKKFQVKSSFSCFDQI